MSPRRDLYGNTRVVGWIAFSIGVLTLWKRFAAHQTAAAGSALLSETAPPGGSQTAPIGSTLGTTSQPGEVQPGGQRRRGLQVAANQLGAIGARLGFVLGDVDDEPTYLTYQRELRESGSMVLNEAMLVLDIIDAKTTSLLTYVAVSVAALTLVVTVIPDSSYLHFYWLSRGTTINILFALIIALLTAVIFCLSVLNIVGAHTIGDLKRRQMQTKEAYEELIIQITCHRRNRYLVAQRISIVTSVLAALIFADVLVGNLVHAASHAQACRPPKSGACITPAPRPTVAHDTLHP